MAFRGMVKSVLLPAVTTTGSTGPERRKSWATIGMVSVCVTVVPLCTAFAEILRLTGSALPFFRYWFSGTGWRPPPYTPAPD